MNPFSLAEMVLTQQVLHADATSRKGLDLLVRVDDSLPDPLNGDKEGLQQLLQQLMVQAINRTQAGLVELTVSCLEQHDCAWNIRFCIRDSGPCLDTQTCLLAGLVQGEPRSPANNVEPRLPVSTVESFSTVSEVEALSTQDPNESAPLFNPNSAVSSQQNVQHLRHCAALAREPLHTALHVVSSPEHTMFLFDLVLDEPAYEELSATCSLPEHVFDKPLSGIRILLVEDSPLTSAFAMKRLLDAGADAVAVDTGEQALVLLQRQAFDVALIDVRMPGMDGYDTVRRIRELGNSSRYADLASLPVVGMNLAINPELTLRVQAAGMDALIPKPIHPDLVLATLRQVCGL